jgi:hypothetical protein
VTAFQGTTVVYQSGQVPIGAPGFDAQSDPDLWLLRDCIFDTQGKQVDMFWQARWSRRTTRDARRRRAARCDAPETFPRRNQRATPDVRSYMLTLPCVRRVTLGALTASLWIGPFACSSGSGATGDGDGGGAMSSPDAVADVATASDAPASDDGGPAACASLGYHADTFASGLKKAGTAGIFTFVLVSADPSPPNDPQFNTWTIQVLDSTGAPVSGASVSLPNTDVALGWTFQKNPWMPNMGHGSSVVNTVTNSGDGTATVKVYFNMTGLWQTFVVAQSGSQTDSATFSFCLP